MLYKNKYIENRNTLIEQLMKEHGEGLARLAFTYVKDKGRAEEIVQDVFIKAYQKMEQFRGESTIKTWLYRITINRCRDELRSSSFRRIFLSNEGIEVSVPFNGPTPDTTLIEKEREKELGSVILNLPVKFREVIILFYYQDKSIVEISNLLKITQNTVKTRLFRARKKIGEKITEPRKAED